MSRKLLLAAAVGFALQAAPASAQLGDPLRFFEGRTESLAVIKVAMKKPFKSRAIGRGVIKPDGSLDLVQRIEDEGEQPRERRWKIRKTGPGHYAGTMNEASGPVTIDEVDGKYRFRFRMAGSIAIEQWLIPAADGKSAASKVIIRKYGIHVGGSDGTVKRLDN